MTKDEKNRKIAEWLFGKSLDGYGIFSASGARLRERDFDTREEAQRYIDLEDERLLAPHKSTAHGVNIQPCVKAHPDFFSSEEASALVLEKLIAAGCCVTEDRVGVLITSPPDPVDHVVTSLVDTHDGWSPAICHTARAEAALALIESEKK